MNGERQASAARFTLTPSQDAAVNDLERKLFIAAGAGSGKTAVVAGRFVEAVARGFATVDEILTITFTRKAAAEMMNRVRDELKDRLTAEADPARRQNLEAAYRGIERARISTMDSFFAQLLRAHALVAGIDPGFTVADESRAGMLRQEAFDTCLQEFVTRHQPGGAELVTVYDPKLQGILFAAIDRVYDDLRSQGRQPALPLPRLDASLDRERHLLLAAIDDYNEAVRRQGLSGKLVDTNKERIMDLLAAVKSLSPEEVENMLLAGKPAMGLQKVKTELQDLEAARYGYLQAARSLMAMPHLTMMSDLLRIYAQTYADFKQSRGMLDFGDLALLVEQLLSGHEDIRRRLAAGFKLVMVDEFQDTSLLQARIGGALSAGNLMLVGDINQSIYGFRDARPELFAAEDSLAARGDYRIPLLENFRSQPEILSFVDHIFAGEDMLGKNYMKLIPAADPDPLPEDFRVEVILVDTLPPGREKNLPAAEARRVEAQLIAERLAALFGPDGGYGAGDTAILVETRNDADVYSDALRRLGIDCYLTIGDSLYEKPELGAIIAAFRLLINPLDDEAMLAVLRSPLVGVSDDGLYRLAQSAHPDTAAPEGARRRARFFWQAIGNGGLPEQLGAADRARLEKFAADLQELRDFAGRRSLGDTCRRLVEYGDFAATQAAEDGQLLANLGKLVDLSVEFEATWGRDLAAFTDFLVRQRLVQAREPEAPIAEEGVDAVRIMTMHSAKGLEFPLVVLAKLGAERGNSNKPLLMVGRDEEIARRGGGHAAGRPAVGLYFKRAGADGVEAFDYEKIQEEKKERERQEEKRLHYVAMTRARRHLILSGAAAADKPANQKETARPFEWIRSRLRLDRGSRPNLDGIDVIDDIKGARVGLSVCADPDALLARAAAADRDQRQPEPPAVNPDINKIPDAAQFVPAVISPTALDTYRHCPRRYYFDNVLRLGDLFAMKPAAAGGRESALSATETGSLVHALLEKDLPAVESGAAGKDLVQERARQLTGPERPLTQADYERVAALLENFRRTPAAAGIFQAAATGTLMREVSFSTLAGETILAGQIDALYPVEPGAGGFEGTVVIDYKTGRADGRADGQANGTGLADGRADSTGLADGRDNKTLSADGRVDKTRRAENPGARQADEPNTGKADEPNTADTGEAKTGERADAYRLQMASYAVAAGRMRPGPVRVILIYLGGDEPVEVIRDFLPGDLAALADELEAAIGTMSGGDFPPLPEADAYYCTWCSGGSNRAAICAAAGQ